MPRFLIDVNLPYRFSLWNSPDVVHQFDLGDTWTDDQIWEYAKEHGLIIVSKDADFSVRAIFSEPPPKVIHIRFGNLKMRDFFSVLTKYWDEAVQLTEQNKLVAIYRDRVEAIG
jgi:predicted nuclease of predicted toxin-antitoxin system